MSNISRSTHEEFLRISAAALGLRGSAHRRRSIAVRGPGAATSLSGAQPAGLRSERPSGAAKARVRAALS